METFKQTDYVHICVQVRSVCTCVCECAHVCMCVNKSHILILNSEFILIHLEILKLRNSNLSVRRPEQPGGLPWVTPKLSQSPGTPVVQFALRQHHLCSAVSPRSHHPPSGIHTSAIHSREWAMRARHVCRPSLFNQSENASPSLV